MNDPTSIVISIVSDYGNRTKDVVLSSLLGLAIIVCWFVYRRYKSSQRDLNKMIKDMESLARAEKELQDLQARLIRILKP